MKFYVHKQSNGDSFLNTAPCVSNCEVVGVVDLDVQPVSMYLSGCYFTNTNGAGLPLTKENIWQLVVDGAIAKLVHINSGITIGRQALRDASGKVSYSQMRLLWGNSEFIPISAEQVGRTLAGNGI